MDVTARVSYPALGKVLMTLSKTASLVSMCVINQHSINLHYFNGLDLTDHELLNFLNPLSPSSFQTDK